MSIKLENPDSKLKIAAAVLVNTVSLSLLFNITFLICLVFDIPIRWAFIVNAVVTLSSIFLIYQTIRSLSIEE